MKIRVASYKVGVPEHLEYECSANELDVVFDDMRFVSVIKVDGTIERDSKSLRYYGHVSADIVRVCGRSLVEVPESWGSEFDWFFETENEEHVSPDGELRELIILDHPMVFRAPTADKPVEYSDAEPQKKSPFESLQKLKKDASGSARSHKKIKKEEN